MTARRPDRDIQGSAGGGHDKLSAMDLDLRTVHDDELGDFLRAVSDRVRHARRPTRTTSIPSTCSRPSAASPCTTTTTWWRRPVRSRSGSRSRAAPRSRLPAVTVVTVHPTHRRRGLLRQHDGRTARRRRTTGRTPRRAHGIGGVDLRTFRLRHRDVHDAAGSSPRSTRPPGCPRTAGGRVRLVDWRRRGVAAARAVYDAAAADARRGARAARKGGGRRSSRRERRAHASSPPCTTGRTGAPTRSHGTRLDHRLARRRAQPRPCA